MPNGISCAYFAYKNHVTGQKEDNLFRESIGVVQTVRTIDAILQKTGNPKLIDNKFYNKVLPTLPKFVYPLIIGSGVYNTVKSKDKLKTGVSQGTGISTMYAFETISQKLLEKLDTKILQTKCMSNNKYLKLLWGLAKGTMFICASLGGYNIGNKVGGSTVDILRKHKQEHQQSTEQSCEALNNPFIDNQNQTTFTSHSNIFDDFKLQENS